MHFVFRLALKISVRQDAKAPYAANIFLKDRNEQKMFSFPHTSVKYDSIHSSLIYSLVNLSTQWHVISCKPEMNWLSAHISVWG